MSALRASRPRDKPRSAGQPVALPRGLEPMLATLGTGVPSGAGWTFEPKYDGIRVLAFATPTSAALVTRNAKSKTAQFPEIISALRSLASRRKRSLVLDGEIVAMRDGAPLRFQELQARMHVQDASAIERFAAETPASLFVFDILVDGDDVLLSDPWTRRRAALERVMRGVGGTLSLTETIEGEGEQLLERARELGWEGVIAKRTAARYQPGTRSRDWQKLKIEHRQEFVVGGFTEPRGSRSHIGALLLGYYDEEGRLIYAGHTGGGFTREGLEAMYRKLKPLVRSSCPFATTPRTNEKAQWVRPEIVVEVKFNEWTSDGKLRQPIFLGIRDDKEAHEVSRERRSLQGKAAGSRRTKAGASSRAKASAKRSSAAGKRAGGATRGRRASSSGGRSGRASGAAAAEAGRILAQLEDIENDGGDGVLEFDDGRTLSVSSLGKVYFPEPGLTKGDAMRHYARVAPYLLPLIAGRPLALKRFPDGVHGPSFYQQNAGDGVPDGVRVETIDGDTRRFVGGDLLTLLYTVQLGSVDVHPWLSRIATLDEPDYIVLDLDPGREAQFSTVVAVARLVRQTITRFGLSGALKTSGSRGLHIFVPMPSGSTYAEGAELAETIARRVAEEDSSIATVERRIASRPKGTVYVDHQQNARGKTVASAYAVRARPAATVSIPLPWSALRSTLDPSRFTITSVPRRLAASRRIWEAVISAGNTRSAVKKALRK